MTMPVDNDEITITKLEAARSQLRTAAELWFTEQDEVSILTLAYASHEVIHRIYRNQGHSDLLFDASILKDEHRSDFARWVKAAPNFFKHARTESADSSITFCPELSAMLLMMSSYAITKMGHELNDVELALMLWFGLLYPSDRFLESVSGHGLPVNTLRDLTTHGRKHFFEAFVRLKS